MDFIDCNCIEDIELKQELLQMPCDISDDKLLYHYTSQKGAMGILQSENIELRFTRIDCLNDITEGNHIIEYYKGICKQLLCEKMIDNEYFDLIIDISPFKKVPFIYDRNITNGIRNIDCCISECITYVFCFSTLSDSLPMWNYYLKNDQYDGFNLGFSTSKLKEYFHYHNNKRKFLSKLIVIEYDEYEKNDILKDYILALYRYRYKDDLQLSKTKIAISRELFKWQYGFKEKFFSHEKEVRLAIYLPLNENKTELATFVKSELRYDNEAGIPKYIFVPLLDKTSLCEVTVSPMLKNNGQEIFSLELTKRGYDVKINHSKIPIRF